MAEIVKTEHPHIVRREGVCGGEPLIDGLRVAVRHVVELHWTSPRMVSAQKRV